jgi:hypothetical protein
LADCRVVRWLSPKSIKLPPAETLARLQMKNRLKKRLLNDLSAAGTLCAVHVLTHIKI